MNYITQRSPLLKENHWRCPQCGGLLYSNSGGHVNLTDCRSRASHRLAQGREGNTIGWDQMHTGWEAPSPKDFFIEEVWT